MAVTPFQKLVRDFEPYLEDARRRMVFITVFFVLLFVTGFLLAPTLIAYLLSHVQIPSVQYIAASPFQVISMSIDVGFAIAVAGTFPLIVAEVYEFVSPALRIRERVLLVEYLTISVLLFLTGFLYGSVSMYYAIQLVAGFNTGLGLQNLWAIAPFFSQILLTSALLGVLFQFPVILALLVRLGIATGEVLRGQRRIVIALVFLLVALLPPTDGLSLIVMSAPLIILYELTVWLV